MEGALTLPLSSSFVTGTPTSCPSSAIDGESSSSASVDVPAALLHVQRQQILCKLQGTVDCYNDCFRSLRLALDDLEILRQENLALSAENLGLSLLLEERENEVLSAPPGSGSVLGASSGIRQIGAAGEENAPPAEGLVDSGCGKTGARGVLPKSISIRSKGFLKAKDPTAGGGTVSPDDAGGSGDAVGHPSRSLPLGSVQVAEETDVQGGIAVQVYNQGTVKTELCNKWEDMGWCPYGDLCQFAHGVDELRPVIRHPRYKTQLCRMLNAPGGCPYGHRCHFRHAVLPKQDC
ncbi:hypothetical protein Taro_026925 [Colocasia esculenta]|uniref:C3H1-type domain-containing protein n=1 Tax=Colocasia esculenta TaxID=4460 RepID=A0A843VCN5_COLES|nr:hypothetical protein [Colocasia esculenta]